MKTLRYILLLVIIGIIIIFISGLNKEREVEIVQEQTFVFMDENNTIVSAEFSENRARVTMSDGRVYDLNQTASASGARYTNEDESFVFWNTGNEVTIFENDEVIFSGTIVTLEQENQFDIENTIEVGDTDGDGRTDLIGDSSDTEETPAPYIGTWTWTETVYPTDEGGAAPQPQSDVFTLTLAADGTVSGTTDCNGFGGAYTVHDENLIDFGDGFWSTLMYCEDSQESEFTALLIKSQSIYQPEGNILVLELANHAGQIIFERN